LTEADRRGHTPGIFISYRREDAPGHAGRLYDALRSRFGEEQVFMDLSIEPGVDFVEQINEAVGSCRLLTAVIGPRWSSAQDSNDRRRLDDPADFVRVELEAGLRQPDVRVIPALVQGATMPSAEELPSSLADLARRNALELSDARWSYDVERLTSTAERVLGERAPAGEPVAVKPVDGQTTAGRARRHIESPSAVSAEVDKRRRAPERSWFRRRSRLAISAAAIAVIVAILAVVFASGGNGGASPQSRLLAAIPSSVKESGCERMRGKDFWLKEEGALVQDDCHLPPGVVSDAVPGGGLTYGLFVNGKKEAQVFVENNFQYEKSKGASACGEQARAQLEAQYAGGNAECYENADGVTISWSKRGSAVGVQVYFAPGTTIPAAVDARAKLL
jgi:hypothetical protein